MDFGVESWAVDKSADDLNTSLFGGFSGTHKKVKKKGKKEMDGNKSVADQPEIYQASKKIKKQKSSKSNTKQVDRNVILSERTDKKSSAKSKQENMRKITDSSKDKIPERNFNDKQRQHQQKGTKPSGRKTDHDPVPSSLSSPTSVVVGGKCSENRKKKNLNKKNMNRQFSDEKKFPYTSFVGKVSEMSDREMMFSENKGIQSSGFNDRKRKISYSETQDLGKKLKPNNQASDDTDKTDDVKKKRRRKKKNSNKRNKYKHLSVKNAAPGIDTPGEIMDTTGMDSKRNRTEKKDDKAKTETNNNKPIFIEQDFTRTDKTKVANNVVVKKARKLKKSKFESEKNQQESKTVKGKLKQSKKVTKTEKFNVDDLGEVLSSVSSPKETYSSPPVIPQAKGVKESVKTGKGTALSLKERMMDKLKSARFRFLNEQLYKQTGSESYQMFEEDEEAFQVYHEGFQNQVSKWPINPVDVIIKQIKSRPRNLVVADFGCGDAKIARSLPNKVHSFDLVAVNNHVTACDMAKVPLKDGTVDIAVFCLSLMGKNLPDYLQEAGRVLKPGGSLKVAEVSSRIQSFPKFIRTMEKFGFRLLSNDTSNTMFCLFDFKKSKPSKNVPKEFHLEPCLYKRR